MLDQVGWWNLCALPFSEVATQVSCGLFPGSVCNVEELESLLEHIFKWSLRLTEQVPASGWFTVQQSLR